MPPSPLALVIPGLLGPFPGVETGALPEPEAPALRGLLRTARPRPGTGIDCEAWLCQRFGVGQTPAGDWPVAPIEAAGELDEAGTYFWLRADPVHLHADRSRLILFGPAALAIRQEEADTLAASFNDFYQADGLQLFTPCPGRWYLRLAEPAEIATTPLAAVIGRDIDRHLPGGRDARLWHARLNEIQMLFHAHVVNAARAREGRPAINSLWLWGGGTMPPAVQAREAWVFTTNPLARARARASGLPCMQGDVPPLADWLPALLERGPGLVVLDDCRQAQQYGDAMDWAVQLQALETHWFAPLRELRARGRVHDLELLAPPGGACQIGRQRWWERLRRTHPLRHHLVR